MTLEAHLFRIHGFVGLEIIDGAAHSPCPGLQHAPVVRLARPAFVHQADDALRKPGAVVGLVLVGTFRITPAFGQHLLLPGRPRIRRPALRKALGHQPHELAAEAQLHDDRNRPFGVGRSGQGQIDIDLDRGIGGVVHVAEEPLGYDRHVAVLFRRGADDLPAYLGQIGGNAAENLAVEVLDDLRTALGPPDFSRCHRLAVFEHAADRAGSGIDVGLRLVVVGRIG